jgi:RNA polymerase sigma-70 factor (ECF subfamily)
MTRDELAEHYRRFGPLVLGRCRRVLRDEIAAEDALQEVFMRVWRYEHSFARAESKVGWLYRTADRYCFDVLAHRKSRRETALEPAAEPRAEPHHPVDDREVVLRFLAHFDARTQKVAVLHYLDGMGQEEIARATGWSRQTVWRKLGLLRDWAARLRPQLLEGYTP